MHTAMLPKIFRFMTLFLQVTLMIGCRLVLGAPSDLNEMLWMRSSKGQPDCLQLC